MTRGAEGRTELGGTAESRGRETQGSAAPEKAAEASPTEEARKPSGWRRTVKTYSWSDGPHPDVAGSHVDLFLTIAEASELKREHVEVTFGPSVFEVRVNLPGNRKYTFRRDSLYAPIDPARSSWFLTKNKRRIKVILAKKEANRKWHGLTSVSRFQLPPPHPPPSPTP